MEGVNSIGARQPKVVLYMENQPIINPDQGLSVAQLIVDNGNHWRKILTILAKLCCAKDWRFYRDKMLLGDVEQICFSQQLSTTAKLHIFAGQRSRQRFGVNSEHLEKMQATHCNTVHYCQDASGAWYFYTPYFDYRQFPNALIAQVKLLTDRVVLL